jgi:hypothetical protein
MQAQGSSRPPRIYDAVPATPRQHGISIEAGAKYPSVQKGTPH